MKKLTLRVVIACLAGTVMSCNKSKFDAKKQAEPAGITVPIVTPGIEEATQGGSKAIGSHDNVTFAIQSADWRVINTDSTKTVQPVDLVFALDVTASMEDTIATVKNGIVTLTKNLAQQGINLNVGLTRFVDSTGFTDRTILTLSDKLQPFIDSLNDQKTIGNGDYPEASIYGIRKGLQLLGQSTRPEALKALVLITDVVGHNGADQEFPPRSTLENGPDRDCTVGAFVQEANDFAAKLPSAANFKFFYTVPDPSATVGDKEKGASYDCNTKKFNRNGYNATAQMTEIMNGLKPESRGGMLVNPATDKVAWPLTDSNFVPSITKLLQTKVATTDTRGLCLASEASMFEGDKVLGTWKAQDQNEMVKQFQSGDSNLPLSVKFDANNTVGTHNLQLKVQRCCVNEAALGVSPLACAKNYIQVISYQITAQ